tara:strand:+ start:375 stop:665 length:291 start_codon:yes stop_codon:yes gene_type:complete
MLIYSLGVINPALVNNCEFCSVCVTRDALIRVLINMPIIALFMSRFDGISQPCLRNFLLMIATKRCPTTASFKVPYAIIKINNTIGYGRAPSMRPR